MKKSGILLAVLLVIFIMATFGTAEEEKAKKMGKAWSDMENCDFCAKLPKDLMAHMKYEQHRLSNGVMIITTFPPEYKQGFDKASADMAQLGMDMQTGAVDPATVKMCGHCEYYGKMMESGAKFEHVSTSAGEIDLITSDDEKILQMIKTYADNNDKAMVEWQAMKKEKTKME